MLHKIDLNALAPVPLATSGVAPEQVHVFNQRSLHAVNAALAARRPLLVRGEPGTGKTQLARAAAKVLGRAFIAQVVDSRTDPRDLLWHFDAVGRLAEAQLQSAMSHDEAVMREKLAIQNFVRPGPLWWAFDWPSAEEQALRVQMAPPLQVDGGQWKHGCVLLIDEIDKAESDVPNALLEALGNGSFLPMDRAEPVEVSARPPLVVITTNEERTLPDAFIRRCLVLHLKLPEESSRLTEHLVNIGEAHFPQASPTLLQRAAEMLVSDREKVEEKGLAPPGQAEYLDLVRAVQDAASNEDEENEMLHTISTFVLDKHEGTR
ncbi:MAG: MoxR family ATPase [Verrucomicrobiota bacterium]